LAAPLRERPSRAKQAVGTTQAGHHTPHSNSGHTHLQQHTVRQEKEEEKTFKSNVTDLAAPLRERPSRAKQAVGTTQAGHHTPHSNSGHTHLQQQAVRQEKEEEKTFKSNVTDLAAPLRERPSRAKQAVGTTQAGHHTPHSNSGHTHLQQTQATTTGRKRKKKKHLSQMSPTWPLRCGSDQAGPNRLLEQPRQGTTHHTATVATHTCNKQAQAVRQEKEEEKTFKSNVTDLAAPLRERPSRAKQAVGTTQAGHHTPHSNSGHTHLQQQHRQSGRKRKKKKHLSQMSPTWPLRCGSDQAGPNRLLEQPRQGTTHHHSNSGHTHLQQQGSQAGKGRRKNI
jgi:hypothetical protein